MNVERDLAQRNDVFVICLRHVRETRGENRMNISHAHKMAQRERFRECGKSSTAA